jgi:hypothetical protein
LGEALSKSLKNEEIRGLFVLGLLAVLVSIRIQQKEMVVQIGQGSFDVMFLLNINIVLWSFYAFFMVLGLSADIVGATASERFKETARMFLILDFVVLGAFSSLLGLIGYGARLFWASFALLVFALSAIVSGSKPRMTKLKKPSRSDIGNLLKSLIAAALVITIALGVMNTLYATDERWVIPSAMISSAAGVVFFAIKDKLGAKRSRALKEKRRTGAYPT